MTSADISPIRPLGAKPDRANAERQRRFRKRRKAKSPVTAPPAVTPPVTVMVPATAGIDVAAYTAAIVLAGAAAFFSIKGMVVLFPGAPQAVVGMAVAMEGAKLVTAGWLARRWCVTAWSWRLVLVALVAGLAIINWLPMWASAARRNLRSRRRTQPSRPA